MVSLSVLMVTVTGALKIFYSMSLFLPLCSHQRSVIRVISISAAVLKIIMVPLSVLLFWFKRAVIAVTGALKVFYSMSQFLPICSHCRSVNRMISITPAVLRIIMVPLSALLVWFKEAVITVNGSLKIFSSTSPFVPL
jgi:hypothetical protein